MGIVQRIQHWHHPESSLFFLIARIILGIIFILKAVYFISNSEYLRETILESRFAAGVGFLVSYITFAHLFGGVFIIIGLFTRLSILLQLPVLVGALFFVFPGQDLSAIGFEILLVLVVLGLCILLLLRGHSELSADHYRKHHRL